MASFIKSAFSPSDWIQDNKTEFCFIGRSNVGKSSLINAMANNKIAVVSKTPGRTRLANFYDFGKYRLIDLPGYGFAQSDAKTGKDIIHIVNKYIAERKNLFGVFQLVDSGVITKEDLEVSQEIREKFANYIILANKIDKLSKNELFNKQNEIAKKFNINVENVVLVSAKTKTNINLIFSAISKW